MALYNATFHATNGTQLAQVQVEGHTLNAARVAANRWALENGVQWVRLNATKAPRLTAAQRDAQDASEFSAFKASFA